MTREDRALLEDAFALDDHLRAERQAEEQCTTFTKENAAGLITKEYVRPLPEPQEEIFTDAQGEVLSRMVALIRDDAHDQLDRALAPLKAKIAELTGRVEILTALLADKQRNGNSNV